MTSQSSEFASVRVNSPNFYSAYHTPLLTNGFSSSTMATMNGLTPMPITTSNAMNTTTTALGLQKAAAATVAQQKQIQQQQSQSQQQQNAQHIGMNAVNNVVSLKQPPHQQQPLGSQTTSQLGTQSPYILVSANTLKRAHNNIMHNNSPANHVEKLSPHLTPNVSPTIPTNIHQVT